jgi:hypothetical protein
MAIRSWTTTGEPSVAVGARRWSMAQPHGLAYWERLADILNLDPVQNATAS